MGGEQDGGFQFAGVHIVVTAGGDGGGGAGLGPVFTAGIEPYPQRTGVLVGLLHNIGQYGVASVGVDHDQPPCAVRGEGLADVGDDRGQGGGADADGAGERGVLVRAAERYRRQRQNTVVVADGGGDGAGDEGVGAQGQMRAVLLERPDRQHRDSTGRGGVGGGEVGNDVATHDEAPWVAVVMRAASSCSTGLGSLRRRLRTRVFARARWRCARCEGADW